LRAELSLVAHPRSGNPDGNYEEMMKLKTKGRGLLWSVCGAGLVVLLMVSSGLRGADTLPTQIADDVYWKLIDSSSEPTGEFQSENFTSNENGFQKILPDLLNAAKQGGVYLGVGPEQNFTYIAALHPKIVFIVDIRRQNLLQHMFYKAAFELADNRADFLSLIFARKRPVGLADQSTIDELLIAFERISPDDETYAKNLDAMKDLLLNKHKFGMSANDQALLEHVSEVFKFYGPQLNYGSTYPPTGRGANGVNGANFTTVMTATDPSGKERGFLASEENYRVLRELERKNLVIPVVGDFGGPKALRAVGQYLKDHGATVTAYYTSNVEQYLFNQGSGRGGRTINGGATNFYENVGTLPLDASSVFIRSGVPGANGGGRGGGNGMNNSQIAPIQATVNAYRAEKILGYNDIFFIQN
jgi:hypothetical protein